MTHDEAREHEETAFDYLLKRYGWKIFTTPHFALVDGVAVMDNEITHVVEFKSRNESLSSMERFGTYLISNDKIVNGMEMARMMCVPFILIVCLIKDGTIIAIEIGDQYGLNDIGIEVKPTTTQRSIEGGKVIRNNAFINIDNFHIL